jgi:hypothetical protein
MLERLTIIIGAEARRSTGHYARYHNDPNQAAVILRDTKEKNHF